MTTGSSLVIDLAVVAVLLLVSAPIISRYLRHDPRAPWLVRLLWVSLCLHLLGSFAQNWVVAHVYHGSADYVGYEHQGADIASALHHGSFSFGSLHIPGNDMVGLTLGFLFFVMTPDQIGGFLVFSWFAFLGLLGFFRAFCLVLPQGDHRRYGYLLFLLPSLLYWSSASGKEAVMVGTLGLATVGAAKLFTHRHGGLPLLAAGLALGALYRPHESLLLFASLCIAFILRRPQQGSPLGPLRWAVTATLLIGGLVVLSHVSASFLHVKSLNPTSVTDTLQKVNTNTIGKSHAGTAGFGSSVDYSWSPSLRDYPKDVYIVLLQPLPWQAHGLTQIASALENLFLLGLAVVSWRRLGRLPRAMVQQPYVTFAVVFSLGFIYLFSSLGNLGLLAREKVLLFPLLFVPLCLPKRNPARSPTPAEAGWPVAEERRLAAADLLG